MEKLDLIVEMIKDVKESVTRNSEHLNEMKVDVHLNRKDLEIHMEQTRAVKELTLTVREEAHGRIEKIEKKLTVGHLLKLIVTVAGGLGTIVGTIYGISQLF